MQQIRLAGLALALGGLIPGVIAAGCNAIAGIQEAVPGPDAAADSTTEGAPAPDTGVGVDTGFGPPVDGGVDAPGDAGFDAPGDDTTVDAPIDALVDAPIDTADAGGGPVTFLDSTLFDAGVPQRIGGLAVYSKALYFSMSGASGKTLTSIMRCPTDSASPCTSPETVAQGIVGGAGSVSVDYSSVSLAGTTGVPDNTAGTAFLITGLTSATPTLTTEGIASQNLNYFTAAVANASAVAWIDLDRLGVDLEFAGTMGGSFDTPTYSTSPGSPTALLSVPAHSALYFSVSTSAGGQIWRCPMPGCGASTPAEVINGNSVFGSPNAFAYDGTNVFFTASGIGVAAGGVYAFNLTTQTLIPLAAAQAPKELTVDLAGRVYWIDTSSPQTIQWCPTTGCPAAPAPPNSIAIGAAPANAGTTVLVADDTSLYWNAATTAGSWTIQRIALPP
jgi:hypothetical protein